MELFFSLNFDSHLGRRAVASVAAKAGKRHGYGHWQLIDQKDRFSMVRAILAAPRSLRRFGLPLFIQLFGAVMYYVFVPLIILCFYSIYFVNSVITGREKDVGQEGVDAEASPQFHLVTETPMDLEKARSLIRELLEMPHTSMTVQLTEPGGEEAEDHAEYVDEEEMESRVISKDELLSATEEQLGEMIGIRLKIA